jgi:hypothetical protein
MVKTIQKDCLNCGELFDAPLAEVKRGNGKFCNLSCTAVYRNKHHRKLNRREEPIVPTRNIYYLVGLITSDGNLGKKKKRLTVTSKDVEIIEHTREIVKNEITGRTYKPIDSEKNGCIWWNYRFTSYHFYDFCTSIGLMPNKSLRLKELKIPKKYFSDFLRGVIDGDGNYGFSKRKYINISIYSGSEEFLNWLLAKIRYYYKISGGAVYPGNGVYTLTFGEEDSLRILPRLYKDGTYWLTRKKQIVIPYL